MASPATSRLNMWLFTKLGFFSVTHSSYAPGFLQVRARVKSDLERLILWHNQRAKLPFNFNPRIIELDDADYRYRVIFSPEHWASVMSELALDLDYGNFKGRISSQGEHARARVYGEVWGLLYGLEAKLIASGEIGLATDTLDIIDDEENKP